LENGEVLVSKLEDIPGLTGRIPVDFQVRCSGRCLGNRPAAQIAQHRQQDHGPGNPVMTVRLGDQNPAEQGAQQNGEIGTHLDPGVAADQFFRFEVLGHDAVFGWPEQRRLPTHQKQQPNQQRHIAGDKADRCTKHDDDF